MDLSKLAPEEAAEVTKELERAKALAADAKKAFEDRDEAKRRLKEFEDAAQKAKDLELSELEKARKDAKEKADALSVADAKAKEWDAYQAKRRETLLAKIKDDKLKGAYAKMDIADLEVVVESTETKGEPDNGKGARKPQEQDNPYKAKPGETRDQWKARIATLERNK